MKNLEDYLTSMATTPGDIEAVIRGLSDPLLSKRPDDKNWAAKEIVCHMRDTEEQFMIRFQTIMALDEPKLLAVEAERWSSERQYLRNDGFEALSSFRKRRNEVLEFLRGLNPEQWNRGGIHPTRGRMSIKDFVTFIAGHDQNHLEQLKRAVAGQP
ncbi:MAG: DinB family protein [Pseudomonadota bacterium]